MKIFILIGLMLTLSSRVVNAVVVPDPPALAAKGYVLMDAKSGEVIVEGNSRKQLAPASLTKLMTAYVVGKEMLSNRLNWQDKVVVSNQAWSVNFSDSSKMFIKPGDEISVRDLLRGVIVQSGNDASVALAEHIAGSEAAFVSLMNGYASQIGMQDTQFVNAHGLDREGIRTSPLDMAILMQKIIDQLPEVYALYSERLFTWNEITQYNRNKLLWDKSINVDGGKTGYTEKAGYSLVSSATEGSMRLIAVVMGANSKRARIEQSKNLLSYGFRFFDTQKVAEMGGVEARVRIWKGTTDTLDLIIPQDVYLTQPRSLIDKMSKEVIVEQPLIAPIQQGQKIGEVVWKAGEEEIASSPLVSEQVVDSASWWGRIWDSILLWSSGLLTKMTEWLGGRA